MVDRTVCCEKDSETRLLSYEVKMSGRARAASRWTQDKGMATFSSFLSFILPRGLEYLRGGCGGGNKRSAKDTRSRICTG